MQTIVAAFSDQATAQRAVESLIENGFSRSAVHLQGGYSGTSGQTETTTKTETHEGFFASVEHFFSNLFDGQDDDARTQAGGYSEAVRKGRSVVAVDAMTDAEVDDATSLLHESGAIDIDEQDDSQRGALSGAGATGATGSIAGGAALTSAAASEARLDAEGQAVMPVVEEELQVGKRTVDRGGIRVLKRVTETPVSEIVNLREERAVVERRPVDRPATEADFANFKEGTLEVRERGEEAVVAKTARVVEEVVVGKEVSERAETISDTVRRTDVEVETLDTQVATTPGKTVLESGVR